MATTTQPTATPATPAATTTTATTTTITTTFHIHLTGKFFQRYSNLDQVSKK